LPIAETALPDDMPACGIGPSQNTAQRSTHDIAAAIGNVALRHDVSCMRPASMAVCSWAMPKSPGGDGNRHATLHLAGF
jgi:hypothetical protein